MDLGWVGMAGWKRGRIKEKGRVDHTLIEIRDPCKKLGSGGWMEI